MKILILKTKSFNDYEIFETALINYLNSTTNADRAITLYSIEDNFLIDFFPKILKKRFEIVEGKQFLFRKNNLFKSDIDNHLETININCVISFKAMEENFDSWTENLLNTIKTSGIDLISI